MTLFAQNNASIEKNNASNVKISLLSDLILRDGILYDASFKPYTGKAIILHEANYSASDDMPSCKEIQHTYYSNTWRKDSRSCNADFTSYSSLPHDYRALCHDGSYVAIYNDEKLYYRSGDEACGYYDISDMIGLETEFFIKDGIKNGQYIEFYPTLNNSIKLQGSYLNNIKDGTWEYYNKLKTITQIENYKDGQKHGKWIWYDKNGDVKAIENYKDGEKHGEWIVYDGSQISTIENYKDGEKHGKWTVYNGSQIILIENYQFGKLHGERIEYYNTYTAPVKVLENYNKGKLHGDCFAYYSDTNSSLKEERHYVDGMRYGRWIYYKDSGLINHEKQHENGAYVYFIKYEYYKETVIAKKSYNVDPTGDPGALEGLQIIYNRDGSFKEEYTIKNGKRVK